MQSQLGVLWVDDGARKDGWRSDEGSLSDEHYPRNGRAGLRAREFGILDRRIRDLEKHGTAGDESFRVGDDVGFRHSLEGSGDEERRSDVFEIGGGAFDEEFGIVERRGDECRSFDEEFGVVESRREKLGSFDELGVDGVESELKGGLLG